MEEKQISYAEAMAKIEEIIRAMNEGEMDVDGMGKQVENAVKLIAVCKEKLQKAQTQIDNVLAKKEQ